MKICKLIFVFSVFFFTLNCSNSTAVQSLDLEVQIKGLSSGRLFILREKNNKYVKIDSHEINLQKKILFKIPLNEPEILFLVVDRKATRSDDNVLYFFAEPKPMQITTNIENFSYAAEITGSENHNLLTSYQKGIKKLSHLELEYLNEQRVNSGETHIIDTKILKINRKKTLYATNFAFSNRDKEIAPYIALINKDQWNFKISDSLYNSLSTNARNSIYGKQFQETIKQKKELFKSE
jgi:hypothetical protein